MAGPDGNREDPVQAALQECRAAAGWALLFGAGVNLLYLAPSLYMMQVYDRVLKSGGLETLLFVSLVLALALLTLVTLDALRTRVMARISLKLDRLMAPRLLDVSLRKERSGREGQIVREFDSWRQAVTGPAMNAIMDCCWAPIFVFACFLIHFWIGILAVMGAAVLVLIAIRNEHALREGVAEIGELSPRLYAAQDADKMGGEAVRALGMRRVLIERQMAGRAQLNELQTRTLFGSVGFSAATKFWRMALQSAALGLGAYLAIERQISPGALIAGSILVARVLAPFEQIVGAWRQIGQARSSYEAVRAALQAAPEDKQRTKLPTPLGALRFERVSVRIPDSNRLALSDVSFSLSPGEIAGVLGASGAGKSTLARAAVGAIGLDAGAVRLDGANLNNWDQDALGAYVGYLPQEVALIAGTIAENIRRFETRTDDTSAEIDAAVIAAARAALAHDMILRLPNGYDTRLGAGGAGLSFGQAQRLALARALYRDPSLIVLDEPNAHLDNEGEAALTGALTAAKARGAATLIISHRSSILAIADTLIVMRDGRVETKGAREDIMRRLMDANSNAPNNLTPMRPRGAQP